MEDILNFLKNKPLIDPDEDIEFYLERTDHKSNQKYIRFFQISCEEFHLHLSNSSIHSMGWPAKYSPISEGHHLGQENARAAPGQLPSEYAFQVIHA
jgi:hypothetical protein